MRTGEGCRGPQSESGETELALVLHPDYWGLGEAIYRKIIAEGFEQMRFESVIVLLPTSRRRDRVFDALGFCVRGRGRPLRRAISSISPVRADGLTFPVTLFTNSIGIATFWISIKCEKYCQMQNTTRGSDPYHVELKKV